MDKRKVAKELLGLAKLINAGISDGPIGRILEDRWNEINDFKAELEEVIHEYDVAQSYMGGPGEKDAKKIIKELKSLIDELENLSRNTLSDILDSEMDFVKEHGEPREYQKKQQDRMFPY